MPEITFSPPLAFVTKNDSPLISFVETNKILCTITIDDRLEISATNEELGKWRDEVNTRDVSYGAIPIIKFLLLEIAKLREQLSVSSPEKPIQ